MYITQTDLDYVNWESVHKDFDNGQHISQQNLGTMAQSDHARKQFHISAHTLYKKLGFELRHDPKTNMYSFYTNRVKDGTTRFGPEFYSSAAAFVWFSEHY